MNINNYLTIQLAVLNIKINTKVNDLLKVPQSSYFKYYRGLFILLLLLFLLLL